MENYKNYEYSIEEDGYTIYNEGKAWIVQHEPYIPDKSKSYEENAKAQIDEIIASQESAQQEQATLESLAEQITDIQLALTEIVEGGTE